MATSHPLEMWGGVECTFNRVGDTYFNQLEKSGHSYRLSDLDLFADLGIKAIRYPILWELMAPDNYDEIDWSWADERLNRLREIGIRPIVEFVHHGSGPEYAPITTPEFAVGLAHFAGQVAERYPWLDAYTPVNEPLTTARFCGLYGLWYPHGRDNQTFARVLVNQCRAGVLGMEAIRRVNHSAQLIQTEDLGRMYSTPAMANEAEFQNERRWFTFDLMLGRVDCAHPLWPFLVQNGIEPAELEWLAANPTRLDIIGIDYYPTSDRYFDEDLDRYPSHYIALSQEDKPYVNIEAVRVLDTPICGFKGRLLEAWERYNLPVAIAEAHLACTREEQLRWVAEAWQAAQDARELGADVRSVTAWSLLGSFNWNNLVTRDENYYEVGVFDLHASLPRPTALVQLIRELAAGQEPTHPTLAQRGWWNLPSRSLYPPTPYPSACVDLTLYSQQNEDKKLAQPLLIIGATSSLVTAFARECDIRGLPYCAISGQDITDNMGIEIILSVVRPWAIINVTDEGEINYDGELSFDALNHVPHLVSATLDLLIDGESGHWHRPNIGAVSWLDFGDVSAESLHRISNSFIHSYHSTDTEITQRPVHLPEKPLNTPLLTERPLALW